MSDIVESRRAICGTCPYNADGTCILCGCNIETKTADLNEKCPRVPIGWDTEANSVVKAEVPSIPVSFGAGGLSQTGRTQSTHCVPCQSRSR